MPSTAPSVDGVEIEVAGVRVRRRKSARDQIWQFCLEHVWAKSEPSRGMFKWHVSRFYSETHVGWVILGDASNDNETYSRRPFSSDLAPAVKGQYAISICNDKSFGPTPEAKCMKVRAHLSLKRCRYRHYPVGGLIRPSMNC
jgi:hypothetical protein